MNIKMKDLFESLENLEVSESCFQEILEMINREISQVAQNSLPKREQKVKELQQALYMAKNGQERNKIVKDYGVAQKRFNIAKDKAVKGVEKVKKFFKK